MDFWLGQLECYSLKLGNLGGRVDLKWGKEDYQLGTYVEFEKSVG